MCTLKPLVLFSCFPSIVIFKSWSQTKRDYKDIFFYQIISTDSQGIMDDIEGEFLYIPGVMTPTEVIG